MNSPPKIVWSSAFRRNGLITEAFRLMAELQTFSLFLGEFKELMDDSSANFQLIVFALVENGRKSLPAT
jgi:hypothetical protein